MRMGSIWAPLAKAIAAAGTHQHVDCLIDLIGADIAHDLVTVTRYSATRTPEFVKHRRFSDEMVRRYLDSYYVFDPFYASWRGERRLGVMPLKGLTNEEAKRGQYIAGFLAQSEICDEVGILLADGGDWCLGIFLDRSRIQFKDSEIALLHRKAAGVRGTACDGHQSARQRFFQDIRADRSRRFAAAEADCSGKPVARTLSARA